jgi:glutathione S-transferase
MAPKITLYGHGQTPNPLKVAILLEELNVEYDIVSRVSRNTLPY